jgi:protein involved in polysaccharide export with SLBB domain
MFSSKIFSNLRPLCLALLSAVLLMDVAQAQETMAIRPGDLIDVKVFREDDLSGKVRVSSQGEVNLPLIGLVRIGGSSPEAAASAIKSRLADGYLVQPDVMVTVAEYSKVYYTVLGQVQKPGAYELPASGSVTLLQAIGVAGGFTRIANPSKVTLKRTLGGREQVIELNAKRLSKEAGSAPVLIQAGDVITISESLF